MQELDRVEREAFNADDFATLAHIERLWKRLGAGAHLDEWLSFLPALTKGRTLAMRLAHVNEPRGKGYALYFGAWCERHFPKLYADNAGRQIVSNILFFEDAAHRQLLDEMRAALTPGQNARLNSPNTARQRVEKLIKQRAAEARMRPGPYEVNDPAAQALAASKGEDDEPTPSEKELVGVVTRSVTRRGVNQTALSLLLANAGLAKELYDALGRELRAARQDAKEQARRGRR